MLSTSLHAKVFPKGAAKASESMKKKMARMDRMIALAKEHLSKHRIPWETPRPNLPEIEAQGFPSLIGDNIEEHFYRIGQWMAKDYQSLASSLANCEFFPNGAESENLELPKDYPRWVHGMCVRKDVEWKLQTGWTCYDGLNGRFVGTVQFPPENALVFDVETSPCVSNLPLLAVALSKRYIYLWVSPLMTGHCSKEEAPLISFGKSTDRASLLIGHNVSYDRARILEEYALEKEPLITAKIVGRRFLDTLSLHSAVSGLSSRQRGTWASHKKLRDSAEKPEDDFSVSDPERDVLVEGINTEKDDVKDPEWIFNSSLNNLADSVRLHCDGFQMDKSVRNILISGSLDEIRQNFANIATYCANDAAATFGLFRSVWPKFLEKCPHPVSLAAILEINSQAFLPVTRGWEAYKERCEALFQESTVTVNRLLTNLAESLATQHTAETIVNDPWLNKLDWTPLPARYAKTPEKKKAKKDTADEAAPPKPIGNPALFGKPAWYVKIFKSSPVVEGERRLMVTPKTRIVPFLLKMQWNGKPVNFIEGHGWCYEDPEGGKINADGSVKGKAVPEPSKGSCYSKVPHPEDPKDNVGNLLGKHHLNQLEAGGKMSSAYPEIVSKIVQAHVAFTFWTGYRERIAQQLVIWEGTHGIGALHGDRIASEPLGMIIPCIIPMGTVTRRAVEPTWMTATNPKPRLVGSELKAQVVAPPGYTFIGADVDSQELWIASLLGDGQFGFAGATALAWMTLQGMKADKSDLHSRTAEILGMSRDNAKTFNYGRIYGAGQTYAAQLLRRFNPAMDEVEAKKRAVDLYHATKGQRDRGLGLYHGGTESFMFNELERIAKSDTSKTPALSASISDALLKRNVNEEYITSRVNWAVQSSGVDYLHMLVLSMAYLGRKYQIPHRLAITIHDEVRFLVPVAEQYRAAFALQIANLWTRAMFAYRLEMTDLPLSVAFFSAVDFDRVLRKEPTLNCLTPSNPTPVPPGFTLDIYQLLERLPKRSPLSRSPRDESLFDGDIRSVSLDSQYRSLESQKMTARDLSDVEMSIRLQMDGRKELEPSKGKKQKEAAPPVAKQQDNLAKSETAKQQEASSNVLAEKCEKKENRSTNGKESRPTNGASVEGNPTRKPKAASLGDIAEKRRLMKIQQANGDA